MTTKHSLHSCKEDSCSICDGGLAWCIVCKGGEASLASECCERKLTEEEEDKIMNRELNFKDG